MRCRALLLLPCAEVGSPGEAGCAPGPRLVQWFISRRTLRDEVLVGEKRAVTPCFSVVG